MLIKALLRNRVLVLDGPMGTMIQQYDLPEEAYRMDALNNHKISLKGNYDLLSLTSPNIISSIHERYLLAGADIITTNTFMANCLAMSKYDIDYLLDDINRASVALAIEKTSDYNLRNPQKPRFVAGSIGPTCYVISDTFSSEYRLPFSNFLSCYESQIRVLIEEGVDLLLIETAVDLQVAIAALTAAYRVMEELHRELPIVLSFTLSQEGTLLSGESIDIALERLQQYDLLALGLNCSFGASEMGPYIKTLVEKSKFHILCYPNAGLPTASGMYRTSSSDTATVMNCYLQKGWLNIAGGCCGTTDEYIAQLVSYAQHASPFVPEV